MTDKKTSALKPGAIAHRDTPEAPPVLLRTIWNTSCGGYPGRDLGASAGTGKSTQEVVRKTAKTRAKAV